MEKRPAGTTIIAIIFIILGLVSLLWSGLVLGFGGLRTLFGGLIGAEGMAAAGLKHEPPVILRAHAIQEPKGPILGAGLDLNQANASR